MNTVYERELEDRSGFGIFVGRKKDNIAPSVSQGGQDRWEQCVGFGKTSEEAWKDYQNQKKVEDERNKT
jgi:hypothetical protein